jgi:hypothetical protein
VPGLTGRGREAGWYRIGWCRDGGVDRSGASDEAMGTRRVYVRKRNRRELRVGHLAREDLARCVCVTFHTWARTLG